MRRRLVLLTVAPLVVTASLALGVGHADPPPAHRRYTLVECLSAAERSYPGLVAASHKIGAAHAQLDEAWFAPFFPITASGFISYAPEARGNPTFSPDAFGQNPFTGSYSYIARATVDTGVPISPWSWVRLGRVRDAARQGIRVSEAEHAKARLELRMNVRKAYYGLQFARDAQYLLDQAQHYLDDADRQVREGLDGGGPGNYSQVDIFRLGAQRGDLEGRRAESEAGEHTARRALGALTGIGPAVDVVDEPLCPMATSLHPLPYYLTRAQADRPDVHMLSAGVEARRAALDIQRWAYLPDLALGITAAISSAPSIAEQANPFAGGSANFAYWGAGVGLRWNFEPLTNAARVRRLSEELAMTEAQQRLALGGIAVEVGDLYERAEQHRHRVEAYGRAEANAFAWLTAVFQQYQAGDGDTGVLVPPLQQYVQFRYSHLQAVYEMDKALADLALATGSDEVAGAPVDGCVPVHATETTDAGVTDDAAAPGPASSEDEINRLLAETASDGADAGAHPTPHPGTAPTDAGTPRATDAGVRLRGNPPR